MSNEEIVQELQAGIDVTLNQERLWNKNKGMVYKMAKRCCTGEQYRNISDDLIQQGFIGLINAATKYSVDGDAKFICYAIPFIRGAMFTYMASAFNIFHIPQYMRQKLREYDVFMKDSYNCELPENEICQKLSMTKRELRRMEEIHNRLKYYSADAPVKEDDEQSVLIDGIPSDIDIEGKVLAAEWEKDLHNTLQEAFGVLDKKTLQMIKCFYYLGYGKTKIARMTNCSGSYVGSRIERGLKKMRNAYGHELAEFMDDGFCYDEDQISENEYIEEDDEQCNLFLI